MGHCIRYSSQNITGKEILNTYSIHIGKSFNQHFCFKMLETKNVICSNPSYETIRFSWILFPLFSYKASFTLVMVSYRITYLVSWMTRMSYLTKGHLQTNIYSELPNESVKITKGYLTKMINTCRGKPTFSIKM